MIATLRFWRQTQTSRCVRSANQRHRRVLRTAISVLLFVAFWNNCFANRKRATPRRSRSFEPTQTASWLVQRLMPRYRESHWQSGVLRNDGHWTRKAPGFRYLSGQRVQLRPLARGSHARIPETPISFVRSVTCWRSEGDSNSRYGFTFACVARPEKVACSASEGFRGLIGFLLETMSPPRCPLINHERSQPSAIAKGTDRAQRRMIVASWTIFA